MLSILVLNIILAVIAVLLVIAEKKLVNYGACKVSVIVGDEKKEFVVDGGNYLIGALTDNKINVSSSCGGKATCGYCKVKVLSGGGEILPTEELFMSRQEKLSYMRLACQVKIRNDIEVFIPDYLETVRSIVKNRTYDPKLRWTFKTVHGADDLLEGEIVERKISPQDKAKVDQILAGLKYKKGSLILVLQAVNSAYRYFPESVLWYVHQQLKVPLSMVFRVATFYNAFSLKPKGRNIIKVCMGTSCYVKGGSRILAALEGKLGIKVGGNTKDLKYSLETVNCIGCCGQSPVISVNDNVYGYFKPDKIDEVLRKY